MTDARTLLPQDTQAVLPKTVQTRTPSRAPYQRPALERLGTWSARTLQMTIPVEPL